MTDAVVVGGGPAGAALATLLARAGREVVVVEREAGPADKVCGEFLSHEAAHYLAALGLDLPSLGALTISAVRLAGRRHTTRARLPFPAFALSRRVLDEALIHLAAAAGATVHRGARVTELGEASGAVVARLADGATVTAAHAFVATGKHDLRGHRRPAGPHGDLVAFKVHCRPSGQAAESLSEHVELALFEGGYAGLCPVEGDRMNLCLVVRRRRFAELGQRWDRLLDAMRAASPHLAGRLAGAEIVHARPLALSPIPYGHVKRRSAGAWYLGDQAAVIPSFTGDGLSIALHSAHVAARVHLAGGTADAFQRLLARDLAAPVVIATGLSHALVRGSGQAALGAAARLSPGLVARVARATRVPDAAIAREGC